MHPHVEAILKYKNENPYVNWDTHQIEAGRDEDGNFVVTGHRRATAEEIAARKGLNPPKKEESTEDMKKRLGIPADAVLTTHEFVMPLK